MNNQNGILIIAGGSTMYGNLALALAASIRARSETMGIAVAYHAETIAHNRDSFTKIGVQLIEMDYEQYHDSKGKRNFFKAKTHIYELTPFENTLFLDSDMLWLNKKPEEFFEQFEGKEFSICNEGKINVRTGEEFTTNFYMFWAGYDEILSAYGSRLGDFFYQCRSEIIYFKKCKNVRRMFSIARKIYDNPKVEHTKIGGHTPDELAFNIATSICSMYPHKDKWVPAYWWYREQKVTRSNLMQIEITNKFPLLSVGGNIVAQSVKKMYEARAEAHFKKLRIRGVYTLKDKRDILPERQRI